MGEVEHVLMVHNKLGEGPVWSVEEHVLYWVDVYSGNYYRYAPTSGKYETVSVGVPIGVLALRASGGLIMATWDGFAFWEPETQELRYIAKPEAGKPYMVFNEGAVDCAGRFWAGSMNQDETAPLEGTLYRLDPDGSVHTMVMPVGIPNGIGWSPDT
jgi:sugar lactone lactonase YvrE